MRTPRQWGKTELLLDTALEWCLLGEGVHLWYVTPYYKQTSEIFLNKLLPRIMPGGRSDPRVFASINRSSYSIRFRNGNVWSFQSAENFQGVRGATLTHLICDEYAYFREGARTQVLDPMLAKRGELAIFCSTPKGKNDFYELHKRCASGAPGWVEFFSNYEETGDPRLLAFAAEQRRYIPDDIYRQEYLAEFIDGGGSVFRHIDRMFSLDNFAAPGARHFAGADLGATDDRTVVVILNERGEMVYFKRFEIAEQNDAELLIPALAEILSMFPRTEAFVEINFNRAILDALRGRHRLTGAFAFNTTNQTKAEAVGTLIDAIDNALIAAPRIDVLRAELENYQVSTTSVQRHPSYSAPPGQHDDCVMALAFAVKLLSNKVGLGGARRR